MANEYDKFNKIAFKLLNEMKEEQIKDAVDTEKMEDVADVMNKKTGIDFKKTKNSQGQMDEAAFSRQHYEAIAKILKDAVSNTKNVSPEFTVLEIGQKLIELFKQDNSRFDVNRFSQAAGLENLIDKD